MLEVCLPGTGGMMPLPERWLSCCWLEYQGKGLLIDCGEGTQIALKEAGCKLSRLQLLLITHFHADHIAGLPGLLLTLGNHGKKTPLTIIGPKSLRTVVSALLIIAPALPYDVRLLEINDDERIFEDDAIHISCLPLAHGIQCFGYRVALKRKPVFNPVKADGLGIPKEMFRLLHAGTPVQLKDGRHIDPSMVLDGVREPISVCFITDTVPKDKFVDFSRGADLLICEGMYGDDEMHQKMDEKGHMVFSDSARLAQKAGVKKLWLTHFSPAMKDPDAYIDNATAIFSETCIGYDGIRVML